MYRAVCQQGGLQRWVAEEWGVGVGGVIHCGERRCQPAPNSQPAQGAGALAQKHMLAQHLAHTATWHTAATWRTTATWRATATHLFGDVHTLPHQEGKLPRQLYRGEGQGNLQGGQGGGDGRAGSCCGLRIAAGSGGCWRPRKEHTSPL